MLTKQSSRLTIEEVDRARDLGRGEKAYPENHTIYRVRHIESNDPLPGFVDHVTNVRGVLVAVMDDQTEPRRTFAVSGPQAFILVPIYTGR